MTSRQARIFAPSTDALKGWVETLLGRVVQPLVSQHSGHIKWFWFSRYLSLTQGAGADLGDCDFAVIPDSFKNSIDPGGPPVHRSIRLRYGLDSSSMKQFESDLTERITGHGYGCSGCLDYGLVGDLGGERFTGVEHRAGSGPDQRAGP